MIYGEKIRHSGKYGKHKDNKKEGYFKMATAWLWVIGISIIVLTITGIGGLIFLVWLCIQGLKNPFLFG